MGVATTSCFGAAAAAVPVVAEPPVADWAQPPKEPIFFSDDRFIKSLILMFVGVECEHFDLASIPKNVKNLEVFFGTGVISKDMAPKEYLTRFIVYSNANKACYICALIYMAKLIKIYPILLNKVSFYRLYLASMVLAIKYLHDRPYQMDYYAKIGGIAVDKLNNLEICTFRLLDSNIQIKYQYWRGFNYAIDMSYQQPDLFYDSVTKKYEHTDTDYKDGVTAFFDLFNFVKLIKKFDTKNGSPLDFLILLTIEEAENRFDANVQIKVIEKMCAAAKKNIPLPNL